MLTRLILLLLILVAPQLHASVPSKNITISDIEVRIPTEKQKKDPFPQAVNIGKKEAFEKLLVSFSRALINPKITDQEIGDLISKVQVLKQLKTKTIYRAKLVYFFKREKVDQFLLENTKHVDMPHVLPKTTLLLPVMATPEGKLLLWEDQNSWREAWLKQSAELPVILPLGDLQDRRLISAEQAQIADTEKLAALMEKYHCSSCILASAKLNASTETEHSGDFQVKSLKEKPAGEYTPVNLKASSKEELFTQAIQNLEPTLKNLVDSKAEIPRPQGPMTALRVNVPFRGPGEYYKIEDCLKKVGLIHHIETESLALDEAHLNLICFGGKEELEKALGEQGLLLQALQNKLTILEKPKENISDGMKKVEFKQEPEELNWD